MTWLSFTVRPRMLALLSLTLALVPAGLAVLTYRSARGKDQRVYETTAQALGEQMQAMFEQHTYYPIRCRKRAMELNDEALAHGKMMLPLDRQRLLPHLLALGYAQKAGDQLLLRWREPDPKINAPEGTDLARNPAVRTALSDAPPSSLFATRGCMLDEHLMLILLAVPDNVPVHGPRGYVLAWIDLNGMCHSSALPLLRDQVLTATLMHPGDPEPLDARRAEMHDGSAKWSAAISRGPRFGDRYGAPVPWLSFLAVGLSALPLLALASIAGRSARLSAELSAEREIARQQRFFTQSISHEFRTPLGIIMSGADLLDSYAEQLTPERRAEVLSEIKDSIRRMSLMVEQVLVLGRIESKRLGCRLKQENLSTLCHEIAKENRGNAVISVKAPSREVPMDAGLISSIIGNVLSNAVKYSPPGGQVTLEAAVDAENVTFTVCDDGIGIPPDELALVFDPFRRCSNVGSIQGTGFGLTIAQRCAEMHHGSVRLESRPGEGTKAVVTIPLQSS